MADKKLGGVREDKLIRLLPDSCHEQDSAIVAKKYGLNYILLVAAVKVKKRHRRVRKREMRVISRGAFLSMFGYESSAFIHSMFLNEKSIRAKERAKRIKAILLSPPSQPRERAQTAPNMAPLKKNLKIQGQTSNQLVVTSSDVSVASPSPSRRHRRKKSRVLALNTGFENYNVLRSTLKNKHLICQQNIQSMPMYVSKCNVNVDDDVSALDDIDSGFLTPPTVSLSPCSSPDKGRETKIDACFSMFSLIERAMKKLCPKLGHKHPNLFYHSYSYSERSLNGSVSTPQEVVLNAQGIASYLNSPEDLTIEGDIFVDLDDQRRHRRSPSFCLSDDESSYAIR